MKHRIFRPLLMIAAVTLLAPACGRGVRLAPVAPPVAAPVTQVVIDLAPKIRGKKERILRKYYVMEAMGVALRQSISTGGDHQLVVLIKGFRTGHWGPTVLDVVADVVAPDGKVTARYAATARSMAGSRRNRIQKVAQKVIFDLTGQMRR